ncbi:hypothetical protein, partial [Vibrio mediterranei]|uniref:hypothetical protein n=1 Tax=Vibrio mediterranei TaxID=689 RepID=UPI00148BEDC4
MIDLSKIDIDTSSSQSIKSKDVDLDDKDELFINKEASKLDANLNTNDSLKCLLVSDFNDDLAHTLKCFFSEINTVNIKDTSDVKIKTEDKVIFILDLRHLIDENDIIQFISDFTFKFSPYNVGFIVIGSVESIAFYGELRKKGVVYTT